MLCGPLGAIARNLITGWPGIPWSHALVGGPVGAVVVAAAPDHLVRRLHDLVSSGRVTGVTKVPVAPVLSPWLGSRVAFAVRRIVTRPLAGARPRINRTLRRAQGFTAAGLTFSHRAHDGQKRIGMLTLVLPLGGFIPTFEAPFRDMPACALAIALGVLSAGRRIVRTVGFATYKARPAAERPRTDALIRPSPRWTQPRARP